MNAAVCVIDGFGHRTEYPDIGSALFAIDADMAVKFDAALLEQRFKKFRFYRARKNAHARVFWRITDGEITATIYAGNEAEANLNYSEGAWKECDNLWGEWIDEVGRQTLHLQQLK